MAAPQTTSQSTGGTVTVGCKLPHGMHLDFNEPGKVLRRVTVRGTNASKVIGGFGITENVPADFFEEWMMMHPELPAVKNGLIFALAKTDSVEAKAKEYKLLKNGLEPLPQDAPAATGVEKVKD